MNEKDFNRLVKNLNNTDWWYRIKAAEILGGLKDPRAVEPLLGVLNDPDADIRETAAAALGHIGDRRAVEPLVLLLRDEYFTVRGTALDALKNIDYDDETTGILFDALKNNYPTPWETEFIEQYRERQDRGILDTLFASLAEWNDVEKLIEKTKKDNWERHSAIQALGQSGDKKAVGPLIGLLVHREAKTRKMAVIALGQLKGFQAVKPLTLLLDDRSHAVRKEVIKTLSKIGGWRAEQIVIKALREIENQKLPHASELLACVLRDGSTRLRYRAIRALSKIDDDQAEKALIAALDDEKVSMRIEVTRALGTFRTPGAAGALTAALNDKHLAVCREAAASLGKVGTPEAVKALIRAFRHTSPITGWKISKALKRTQAPGASALIAAALKDKDCLTREKAAKILVKRGWQPADKGEFASYLIALREWDKLTGLGKDAVDPLIDVLGDKVPHVRKKMTRLLVEFFHLQDADHLNSSVERIINKLQSPEHLIRRHAAKVLTKISYRPANKNEEAFYYAARGEWDKLPALHEAAVPPLVNILRDKGYTFRWKAAVILGKTGCREAIPALSAALEDEKKPLRKKAASAIIEIGGKEAIAPLIGILKDNDLGLQDKAAEVLGKTGDARTIQPLIVELRDDEAVVRERAAAALDKMKWQPPGNGMLAWYLAAKREWEALAALGKDALEPLTGILKGKEDPVRVSAAEALGKTGAPEAADPLVALLSEKYTPLRKAAAAGLGNIDDPRVIEPLVTALKDADMEVGEAAAASLIKIKQIGKPPALVTLLKYADQKTSRLAIDVMDKTGWQPESTDELALYILTKKEWGNTPTARGPAVAVLIDALKSGQAVREKVVDTLGEIGDARAIDPLIQAQEIEDPDFRQKTLLALKKIKGRVLADPVDFLCKQCFLRYKKHKAAFIASSGKIIYYACPNCRCDFDFYAGIDTVVLLLDRGFEKEFVQQGKTLIVNWLKRKELFDYDEIRITDAGDYEVERLVMTLKNDPNDERRQRLSGVPVLLAPELDISPAKMNLLKDNFAFKQKFFGGIFDKSRSEIREASTNEGGRLG